LTDGTSLLILCLAKDTGEGGATVPIIPNLTRGQRRRLQRRRCRERSALLKVRIIVVLQLAEGLSSVDIERNGLCVRSTVSHVAGRFRELGELGLEDGRRGNGKPKTHERVLRRLAVLVKGIPRDFGWARTTWTRELLSRQLGMDTKVWVSRTTMTRWLRLLGARRGRPKLFVECPWPATRRQRCLAAIRALVKSARPGEPVFFEDEVDIHLNPRPGPDWMLHGQQKWVRTPGKNEKRYVAGALNARTGRVVWVDGEHKRSQLFIDLVHALMRRYRGARKVHLVLDNYSIHSSKLTRSALQRYAQRLVLHFLPPFCPDENEIEQLWRDLHANVTRNHPWRRMIDLMKEVFNFLKAAQPYPGNLPSLRSTY
jgi:transposase